MRILVTGNEGYIGSVLAPLLASAGHEVAGLDSGLFGGCAYGRRRSEIKTIRRDIRDVQARDLAGFDAVAHLAGLSCEDLDAFDPSLINEINHLAAVGLARCAREAGVSRFILSSSCGVYAAQDGELVDETHPCNPSTPFEISKARAEQGIAELADPKFSPTFLRNAQAYGASPRLRLDVAVNNFVARVFADRRLSLEAGAMAWHPVAHVQDISRAFAAVFEAPRERVHNRTFNVGRNEDNYRLRDIAEIVADTMPRCRIDPFDDTDAQPQSCPVDFSALEKALPDFQPQWHVRRGAQQLFHLFRDEQLRGGKLEQALFSRAAHLRNLLASGDLNGSLRWAGKKAIAL